MLKRTKVDPYDTKSYDVTAYHVGPQQSTPTSERATLVSESVVAPVAVVEEAPPPALPRHTRERENSNSPNEEITIKEIFNILNRGSVTIFTLTMVFGVIGILLAGAYFVMFPPISAGSVQGVISFNHPDAERGLDPFGNVLEPTVERLRSPEVISAALYEMDLHRHGITVEDIRQNLRIRGLVPRDAMSRIVTYQVIAVDEPNRLEDLLHFSYATTQFVAILNIPEEHSFLAGVLAEDLLTAIFNAYRQMFYDEFLERSILHTPIVTLDFVHDHDFFESQRMLTVQLNAMSNFVREMAEEAPAFRSMRTGLSFGDIFSNLGLIGEIDMANIRAQINIRNLTRYPELRLLSYQLAVEDLRLRERVQREYAEVIHFAIENYERDSIAWFGSVGPTEHYWDFRNAGEIYATLIERVLRAERLAIELRVELESYLDRIARLQATNLNTPARRADMAVLDTMIADMVIRLDEWVEIINETTAEFLESELMGEFLLTALQPNFTGASGRFNFMLLIIMATTAAGFGLSVVFVFLKNLFTR